MVHNCYLSTWEAKARKSQVEGQAWIYIGDPISKEKARHQWLTSLILAMWEAEIRRIKIWGQSRQISLWDPTSKTIRAKWTGGMIQVVECLLCKCEALNSNPSPIEQKPKSTYTNAQNPKKNVPNPKKQRQKKKSYLAHLWEVGSFQLHRLMR
jgi:hypothetical protein